MAHQDPVGPLSEFDTLLRQELSVEPSNNFLPRVREQIRTEPAGAPWMRLWRFVPLAAAAALVLAIGVFMLSRATGPNPEPSPIASAPSPTQAPPAPASPPLRDVPATNLGARPATRDPRPASPEQRTANSEQRHAKDPEVIVDARQRDALHAFVRMVNQGQLTADAFKQTKQPPLHIEEEVPIIGVVPVSVSPIVVGGVLQGESGRK